MPGSDYSVNGVRVVLEVSPSLDAAEWLPAITALDVASATRISQGDGTEVIVVPLKPSAISEAVLFVRERMHLLIP